MVQAIVAIPTMLHGGGAAGLDLGVEEQRAGRNRTVRRIASPFIEFGAEPRFDHCWSFGCRCCRDSAGPHSIGAAFSVFVVSAGKRIGSADIRGSAGQESPALRPSRSLLRTQARSLELSHERAAERITISIAIGPRPPIAIG